MSKRFTFFLEEHDHQASIIKYYKIHSFGFTWQQAFNVVRLPKKEDYEYKLLTLNQYNALGKPSLLATIWESLLAFYPFKYRIKIR